MSGLLGGGPATTPDRYVGIQVTTSMQGQVIPYIAGRQRVGMNLIWYGNFQSFANHGGGGKGGSPTSSYTYTCAYIAALGLGQMKGITQVWYDKSQTSLEEQNLAYALGSSGQATWTGYPSGTPEGQQIPYDHIAYVASSSYSLGSSAAMPDLTFEVEGVVGGYDDANGVYDADPSAIVVDYLTDPVHGAAFQGTIEPLTGTTDTYQAYCMSLGLLVSPYENDQRAATDFMRELMQITNSDVFLSCGTLKVKPYADSAVSGSTPDGVDWSYSPDLTPIFAFTDDDFCPKKGSDPVVLKRKALSDTYNIVNLTYNDRANYYDQAPATASDNYDISIRGPRAMSTLSFQQITQPSVAVTVATLILQFQLYERNTYEFRVPAIYSLLEPMDYISITDSGLGLTGQLCRITQIQDGDDNLVTITAMEVPGTVRNTPQYNWESAQGYYANFGVSPGSVSPPVIFQMPQIPAAVSGGIPIGIAVAPPTVDTPAWGGCQVYCSTDGGDTYGWVGSVGPAGVPRYGTLSANLGEVADPDTTSTLAVALQNTTQQLATTVTDAQANANETLILVGTGATAEVMSYGAASLVSAGNYDLSYLRRGLYGSVDQAHASGAPFVRLDGTIFQLAIDPGMAGQTIYFKFCSYNMVGQATQALSDVTAYGYTVPVANQTDQSVALTARGSCVISGEQVYKAANGAMAWDSDAVGATPLTAGNISAQLGTGTAAIGFVTSTLSTANPTTNMYAIYAASGGVEVIENGTLRYTGAAPAVGDLYDVRYDGFTLYYFVNGVQVWTTPLQGASLYPAIAEETPGAVLGDLQVASGTGATPIQWKVTGVASANNSVLSGGNGSWGGGAAYTIPGYTACHIAGKPNSLATEAMLGLTTTPTAGASYTNSKYAWYANNGTWQIYEGSTFVGAYGAVELTDTVAITYDGTTITYYLNGVSQRTVALSGMTLYGFAPFFTSGAGWNSVVFGPTTNLAVTDTSGLGANAATNVAQTETTTSITLETSAQNLCNVSIGPFATAQTIILTVNASWTNGDSSRADVVALYVSTSTLGNFFNTNSSGEEYAPPASSGVTALEIELSLPASTEPETFTLVGQIFPSSSVNTSTDVTSAMIKVEVIKK